MQASTTHVNYNANMIGCDLSDQGMSYYLRHTKSERPYTILLFHYFLLAVLNGRALRNRAKQVKQSVKTFYVNLKRQLVQWVREEEAKQAALVKSVAQALRNANQPASALEPEVKAESTRLNHVQRLPQKPGIASIARRAPMCL